MGLPGVKSGFALAAELLGDFAGLDPIPRAFINAEQGQQGRSRQRGVGQLTQVCFRPIQQARFQEIQRQSVSSPVSILAAEVSARQKMFMHPHRPLEFATPAKQVTKGEMQL